MSDSILRHTHSDTGSVRDSSCFKPAGTHLRAVVILGIILGITACSSTIQLNSQLLDREMTIDGDTNDWHNVLRPTEKDQRVSIGAINDSNYLYLVITTRNRDHIRSVVRSGLTASFEGPDSEQNRFGIRYPLGLATEDDDIQGDPDALRARWKSQLSELELIQPRSADQRLPADGAAGVQAAATLSSGLLICEYQIPLASAENEEYALAGSPGQTLRVAFETPRPERPEMNQSSSSDASTTGGMGRGRRRQQPQMPDDDSSSMARLDLKTQIHLAE
jgi:hypothetical protein